MTQTYVTATDVDPGDVINLPFDYIEDAAEVRVFVDGTLVGSEHYTWTGALQITAGATFPVNTRVIVLRATSAEEWDLQPTSGYFDSAASNRSTNRAFNILQELKDAEALALKLRPAGSIRQGYVPIMGSDGRLEEGPLGSAVGLANEINLAAMNSALSSASAVSGGNLSYFLGMFGDEVKKLPVRVLYASMFETDGTGEVSDTAAMNALMTHLRAVLTNSRVPVRVYLDGVFLIDGDGINACDLRAWNLEFVGGAFIGETDGEAVWHLIGSRGYTFRQTLVFGVEAHMPTVPFLCTRGTGSADGYCDNVHFDQVTTYGHFEDWAWYSYAQETTRHSHCRYWQYNRHGRVACFEGSDNHPQTSPYKTPLTGAASFINCQYDNIDFRYLPSGNTFTVTGITKANNPTVTISGTMPADGDKMIFWLVNGMTEINAYECTVSSISGQTFVATGINSTGWGTFTSGYAIRMMDDPALYFNRMEQHHFRTCYLVAYGEYAVEWDFIGLRPMQQCVFDFLYEGACSKGLWLLDVGSVQQTIRETYFMAYNTHSLGSFFTTTGSGDVVFYGGGVSHTYNTYSSLLLTDGVADSKYAWMSGVRIFWPDRSRVNISGYTYFRASLGCMNDGEVILYGHKYREKQDGTWVPTITPNSGSITTLGTIVANVRYLGDWVWIELNFPITTNGTGAGNLSVTMPTASAPGAISILNGRERGVGGQQLQARVSGTQMLIYTDDNTYPGADGAIIEVSGWYRRA